MEAQPASSIERSSAKQLNMGMSGALPSSLPVLPDPQPAFMAKELMNRPLTHLSHLNSSGAVGHMFSSSPGCSTDLHHSSLSPHGKHSRNALFISQSSSNMASLPFSYSSNSGPPPSTTPSNYFKENNASWHTESLPSFLDFPVNTSAENSQAERSACTIMASEENSKQNDWQEWADQLISDDDNLTPNWNDLLTDNIQDLEPKVKFLITQINIRLQNILLHSFLKKCYWISFCYFRWQARFQNHLLTFPETSSKVISNFLLHLETIVLVLPPLPQQILLPPSQGCVGHQSFMRLLWRLSTNLVAVKVLSFLFVFAKSLALVYETSASFFLFVFLFSFYRSYP